MFCRHQQVVHYSETKAAEEKRKRPFFLLIRRKSTVLSVAFWQGRRWRQNGGGSNHCDASPKMKYSLKKKEKKENEESKVPRMAVGGERRT